MRLLLLFFAINCFAVEVIENQSTLQIRTLDIETRKLRLDNALEVLLISDPGTPESAVALSVDVGQWQDPDNIHGLAHFTEHIVFLGNEQFPEANGFQAFLDQHGGKRNAYTAEEHTNYHFTINNDDLELALERFAPLFIKPLFNEEAMRREEMAVDQEFQRAIQHDGWRLHHVQNALANPNHPISRFSCGNIDTLHNVSSKDAREWFESHYSANLMHLAIISPLPLDELQELVITYFSAIPDRELEPFVTKGMRTSNKTQNSLVVIKPYQNLKELILSWELPYDHETYVETKPTSLIAYCLNRNLRTLKEEGLAEDIHAATDTYTRPETATYQFDLNITLTDEGLEKRDYVIEQCFAAIRTFQQNPIPKELFDEQQALTRLHYEYQTRGDRFDAINALGRQLPQEDLATFPDNSILTTTYDPGEIIKTAHLLTPDRCHITLLTDTIRTSRREKWMDVQYTVQPIAIEAPTSTHFTFPTPNPYIPQNLALIEKTGPTFLSDNEWGRVYYAPDTHYNVPEIAWAIKIKSAHLKEPTAEKVALRDLMARSLKEALEEDIQLANRAGLQLKINEDLTITLSGYSDKAPELLQKLAQTNPIPTEEQFAIYKASLTQEYNNAALQAPIKQGFEFCKEAILKDHIPSKEKANAIKDLTLEDLQAFVPQFFDQTYIEAVLYGNLTETEALAAGATLHSMQQNPFPEGKTWKQETLSLSNDKGPYAISRRIKGENSAAFLLIDQGSFSHKSRAAQQILASDIDTPFYVALRTEQQTGYVVLSFAQNLEKHLYSFFAVESTSHDPRDLLSRYEQFIQNFTKNLSLDRFETIKASAITKLKQPAKNPKEKAQELTTIVFDYEDFDFKQKRIDALEALTFEEYTAFAEEQLSELNKRRIAILLNGSQAKPLRYRAVTFPRLKKLIDYTSPSPDQ